MVGLEVGYFWYDIGNDSFLNSWFSTIHYHLEKEKWGSKYPLIMNSFYKGLISKNDLNEFKAELMSCKKKLKKFKPKEIIWDIYDLSKQPPWGDDISEDITNLSNYFVTCNGKDLFEVLFKAVDKALLNNDNIEINNL